MVNNLLDKLLRINMRSETSTKIAFEDQEEEFAHVRKTQSDF